MKSDQKMFESGRFFVGVNYWASHAGMLMWRNWDEATVDSDLKQLSEAGIEVLRVFPLWPDFQPLRAHLGNGSSVHEVRFGEEPLPNTEAGRCGVDETMADHFETFCNIAQKYGLKLIVALITGWMSGRCFVPDSFAGRNPITDPLLIKWEIRFVRYMVRRFKDNPAIGAWDLGNECNNMGSATRDEAFVWASAITNTVRSEDQIHPMVSGMHGLQPEGSHPWSAEDQGEILDILCTHPYPLFTAHCNTDPINTMKTILHPTAESVYYASMGHKPCFVEEGGTLGPTVSSPEVAADYLRAAMFSSWAHDLLGFCWWCAFDQDELCNAPYDWDPIERELGLFTFAGERKPVVNEFTKFKQFLEQFPLDKLPPRMMDATVVLTSAQDQWPVAYGAFALAKEAGLDVDYAWHQDEIPVSPVYLLPCISGNSAITKRAMDTILSRVENGAVLYISIANGALAHFQKITGLKIVTRNQSPGEGGEVCFSLGGESVSIRTQNRYVMEPAGAKVLIEDQYGNPFMSVQEFGKGKVFFVNAPIETIAASSPCALVDGQQVPYILHQPLYKLYDMLSIQNAAKITKHVNASIGITEHVINENSRVINILNHCPYSQTEEIVLLDSYCLDSLYCVGSECTAVQNDHGFTISLPENTGASVIVSRK